MAALVSMTAALGHLTGSAMRSRGSAARALGILAFILPVPFFAALGLSLPLPATVERIAARLVPFGHAEALDTSSARAGAAGGRIVLAPGEQRPAADPTRLAVGSHSAVGSTAVLGGPRQGTGNNDVEAAAPAAGERGDAPARDQNLASTAPSGGGGTSAPSQNATQSAGTQSGGTQSAGTQSGGGSDPGETTGNVVDTVGSTADGAVTTATGAASSATTTVTDTSSSAADTAHGVADSAGDTATGALGGIHPP